MPFKIVQTIEDGEACLCVVPSKWEVNGTLHWPLKSQIAKLCQIENSVPNEKWEKINCVRKREFSTRNEAIKEMERMEEKTGTEIDDATFNPIVKKTKTSSNLIQPQSSKPDFNSEIPVREDVTEYPSAPSSTVSNNKISTQFFLRNEAISPQILTTGNGTYLLREDEELQGISALETDGNTAEVFVLQHGVHDSEKEIILTKLLENQHKIMQSIAKLQASVDILAKEYKNSISTSKTAAEALKTSDACILTEPIKSFEKLNEIEEQLKNESVINCVVENIKFICGNNGKANGIDCCYKLIDYFITRIFTSMLMDRKYKIYMRKY